MIPRALLRLDSLSKEHLLTDAGVVVLADVAARFANRMTDWIEYRRWSEGASALLAVEEESVAGVRVWLALCELARQRPDLSEVFARAHGRERAARVDLDLGLDDDELDLVLVTVEGFRVRLCDPSDPLTSENARSTLTRLLERLGASAERKPYQEV